MVANKNCHNRHLTFIAETFELFFFYHFYIHTYGICQESIGKAEKAMEQECIPVGCVPSAAVTAGGVSQHALGRGCIPACIGQGVSVQGGVCPVHAGIHPTPNRMTDACESNYVADGNSDYVCKQTLFLKYYLELSTRAVKYLFHCSLLKIGACS